MKPRQNIGIAVGAVVVVAILLFAAGRRDTPDATNPQRQSDASIKATMIDNLASMDYAGVGTSPDIAVTDGVLIVTTSNPAAATQLCRSVAAVTNDPETAQPLGVIGVVIISGGEKIAECRP